MSVVTNYWFVKEVTEEDKRQKPKWFSSNDEVIAAWVQKESYRGRNSGNTVYFEGNVSYSYGPHFPLAVKIYDEKKGMFYLLNGDRYSVTTVRHQGIMLDAVPQSRRIELPFSTLEAMVRYEEDAGVPTSYDWMIRKLQEKLRVIERSDESWLDTGSIDKEGNPIKRHVLGAALFKYGESYYLSSIDESGAGMVGLYFLSKLKKKVNSIKEAYEALKPKEIKMVEKAGLPYERQGEWFFVKISDVEKAVALVPIPEKAHYKKSGFGEMVKRPYLLEHKDSSRERRHFATQGLRVDGRQFVRGAVRHQFGEHKLTRLYDFWEDTRRHDVFFDSLGRMKEVYIGEPGYVTPESKREWYEAFENVQEISWSAEGGRVD